MNYLFVPMFLVILSTSAFAQIAVKGDFDRDGSDDVAVIDSKADTVQVRMGRRGGRGTAGTLSTTTIHTARNPKAIATVDLDQDGNLDFVIAFAGHDRIGFFRNEGNGTFAPAALYRTGNTPNAIIAADFNNDGSPDLAVINDLDQTVGILMNNPAAPSRLQAQKVFKIGAGSSAGRALTAGDFNRDGFIDIAAVNTADATVSVLLNTGSKTGSFKAQKTHKVGTRKDTTGAIACGDFNRDGFIDLVNLNSNESTISILLNDRKGSFAAAKQAAVADGGSIGGIVAADFNKDAILDVAVANPGESSFSVVLGSGNGSFTAPTNYTTVANPSAMIASDFDADGNIDVLVVASPTSESLFFGHGDGTF